MKSIIEVVISGSEDANRDWARVTGQSPSLSYHFRNKETGADYSHIAGAISWPENGEPGCVLILAVDKRSGTPNFYLLEEFFSPSIKGLLEQCVELRKKYGYSEHRSLLHNWTGDGSDYSSIINDFNRSLDNARVMIISKSHDFDNPNSGKVYLNQLRDCLVEKRLDLGSCIGVKNALTNMPFTTAIKWPLSNYPAVAALGHLIHGLIMMAPWVKRRHGAINIGM